MQDSLIELGLRWFKLPTFVAGEPNLSAYDASYLDLAIRLEASIASLDKKLLDSCLKANINSVL